MNDDKELLALALKAAKYDFKPSPDGGMGWINGVLHKPWNPLNSDGDALRLAAALFMHVEMSSGVAIAMAIRDGELHAIVEKERWTGGFEQKMAATRRAIVRAAAEIGRAMS